MDGLLFLRGAADADLAGDISAKALDFLSPVALY